MRYSLGFKKSLLKKVLPPENQSVLSVAKEAGVSYQTLRNWLNKAKEGTLELDATVSGSGRSPREKLRLVIESSTIPKDDIGRWLRENGLHSEHLVQYEQEIRDMVENKDFEDKKVMNALKKENQRLQRELNKKEKALAEMAALYTLKKKAESIWGESEDD